MVVDFVLKRMPAMRVTALGRVGPWREDNLRPEFRQLVAWAKTNRVQTGRWIFRELDGPNSRRPDRRRRWEACLEIKGRGPPAGGIRIKTLPAQRVASVTFDPDEVSARLVYHGLSDWLWWRKKSGEIRRIGPTQEVYAADPWKNARAWAHAEVQVRVE